VLIAQAVFLFERGQTDRQRDATERPNHAGGYTAGVGNDDKTTTDTNSYQMCATCLEEAKPNEVRRQMFVFS